MNLLCAVRRATGHKNRFWSQIIKNKEFEKEEHFPIKPPYNQTECLPYVCQVPGSLLFKTQLRLLTTFQIVQMQRSQNSILKNNIHF
jgi:hypothetical protein